MKVLWLCNMMIPMIAEQLNMDASNKEGWLTGLAEAVLKNSQTNGITLAIAFPAPGKMIPGGHDVCKRTVQISGAKLNCYGFRENTVHPEIYDESLEESLKKIVEAEKPDLIHCFGTEYPHTLAMCRIVKQKSRLLIGLQGLTSKYAQAYFANIPEKVIQSTTFRDRLRQDSLVEQQAKFEARGKNEIEIFKTATNFTGRTEWDRYYAKAFHPEANYFKMNETLRKEFYGLTWDKGKCTPHTIFVSQGDYPIKGLHYMILAMPVIMEKFPDAKVYVAGDSIVKYSTLKDKLKISGYGKYLRKLMRKCGVIHRVKFLGRLTAERMRDRYLQSSLYVCCSSIENSPNSMGEAMLLGMPCVVPDVGGIPSVFTVGEDGIAYEGFRIPNDKFYGTKANLGSQEDQLNKISKRLANAVIEMWSDEEKQDEYCKNAKLHAEKTHRSERNYARLLEIYTKMIAEAEDSI